MKVLHIDTGREMRGGQWQVLQLLRGLREQGVGCRLLARGPLLAAAQAERLNAGPAGSVLQLSLEASKFDVVHAHDAKAHSWAALGVLGKPLVVARRVAFPVRQGFASAWKYRQPTRFIAISEAVRRELEVAGVPAEKIDVVYDGVLVPANVIPYEERRLGCVAIESTDPMKATDIARASGVELQFSRHLTDDLARARIFLYLSRQEGLGSAALLASASATPVVASRVGGLVEAVEHERTGLLVENEPQAAAEAVRRLQADPRWAAKLGQQGRERVKERFGLERMTTDTLAAYRKALA